jgi:hypothetical protein
MLHAGLIKTELGHLISSVEAVLTEISAPSVKRMNGLKVAPIRENAKIFNTVLGEHTKIVLNALSIPL